MNLSYASLLLLLFLVPHSAQLQDEADGPPMLVIKSDWSRIVHPPGWDRSPSGDIGNPNYPDHGPGRRRRRTPRDTEEYTYRATLKNVSEKTAVLIGWDYTFAEAPPDEPSRHPFLSKVKIKPGQKKEVKGDTRTPPTRTVNAGDPGKGPNGKVVVSYVEYGDGASWGHY